MLQELSLLIPVVIINVYDVDNSLNINLHNQIVILYLHLTFFSIYASKFLKLNLKCLEFFFWYVYLRNAFSQYDGNTFVTIKLEW